jgi:hypothetical protein
MGRKTLRIVDELQRQGVDLVGALFLDPVSAVFEEVGADQTRKRRALSLYRVRPPRRRGIDQLEDSGQPCPTAGGAPSFVTR